MLPYSPLHHLLLADVGEPLVMTSGNVSDEPIAFTRRGRARAARRHRRPLPAARPADPHAHRRLGACVARPAAVAAPLARLRAGADRAAGRGARPLLAVRRGAEEHVLRSPRASAHGSATTSATCENYETLRSFADGHRPLRAAVRGRARARRPRPASRLPLDQVRARARGRRRSSASSTTTRTSPRAWPSTAGRRRRSARSSTARATAPTARSGAASSSSATCTASSAPATCWPVPLPGGDGGDRASRGGWRAPGWSRPRATRPSVPPTLAGRSTRRAGAPSRGWPRGGLAAPSRRAWAACSTRSRRSCGVRDARHLRGPGGDRAGGPCGDERARAAPTRCPRWTRARPIRAVGRGRPCGGCPSA